MTYNGWKNHESWSVMLSIRNDEGLREATQKKREQCDFTAETAEAYCRELFPTGTPDMDRASEMDVVDWAAIATAFNEE